MDDPRLAPYAHVGDAAWLREHGLIVAEGRLLVRRALAGRRQAIVSVLVTPPARAAFAGELDPVADRVVEVAPEVLRRVAGFNFHRGCLALLRRPSPLPLAAIARNARRLVGLEGIGNPDNVGGIFRNVAAFAAAGVLIGPATADPFYRKALRTSMGAALDVPWTSCADWHGSLAALQAQGFVVAAFTPQSDAAPLEAFAARLPERLVLLFGAEGDGLRQVTLEAADVRVRIPIAAAVDSLNVAVAAGVALYRCPA